MVRDMKEYDEELIRMLPLGAIQDSPRGAFEDDLWANFFSSCLATFLPLGHDYKRIRFEVADDGALLVGDDGPAYDMRPEAWSTVSGGIDRVRPRPNAMLPALIAVAQGMTVRGMADSGQRLLILREDHRRQPDSLYDMPVKNALYIRPGFPARQLSWVAGRLQGLAVTLENTRVELSCPGAAPTRTFLYRGGVGDYLEESNAHLSASSRVMCLTGHAAGINLRVAMQLYRFGNPQLTTYVNGNRMNRGGSAISGLWAGLARALYVGSPDLVKAYVTEGRLALGATISVQAQVGLHYAASWGDCIEDPRVESAVSGCVAESFEASYRELQCLEGFRGMDFGELSRSILEFKC